ncbi:MAG: hypothetical protein OEZ01_13420 [Candidatus Heimdallarchaeota archaeon]|nr:hypothetical protein [Candidatus Heimdallarchaeota archaeon]MDH5647007.1 hypothetical protein [Candidatus Heimdallarchaeota archaeon]
MPITSAEIASILQIDPGPSNVIIRQYIMNCIHLFKLPVAGTSRGYFLIKNEEELNNYVKVLNKRVISILEQINQISKNYENYQDYSSIIDTVTYLKEITSVINDEVIVQISGIQMLLKNNEIDDVKTNKISNMKVDPLDKWLVTTISGDEDSNSVIEHNVIH